jgi:hypothetical protein
MEQAQDVSKTLNFAGEGTGASNSKAAPKTWAKRKAQIVTSKSDALFLYLAQDCHKSLTLISKMRRAARTLVQRARGLQQTSCWLSSILQLIRYATAKLLLYKLCGGGLRTARKPLTLK